MNSLRDRAMRLLGQQQPVSLSILLPVHRASQDTLQNPIRFKNLIREAEHKLAANGLDSAAVRDLLAPLEARILDFEFWQHQQEGLAVYRTANFVDWVETPWPLRELTVVSPHFHLKPLLAAASPENGFFVLSVSKQGVQLHQCRNGEVHDITPAGVEKAFHTAEPDWGNASSQMHSAGGAAIVHGPGSVSDAERTYLEQSFRRVDRVLAPLITHSAGPVILAGVDWNQALYRSITSFPAALLAQSLGNLERSSPSEIWKAAWPLAEAHFQQLEQQALNEFFERDGHGLTSTDLTQILNASTDGRVADLFVPLGHHIWGAFHPSTRLIELHPDPLPHSEDLLNLAALQGLTHGVKVHTLPAEAMPDGSNIAAIFRY